MIKKNLKQFLSKNNLKDLNFQKEFQIVTKKSLTVIQNILN